MIFDAVYTEKYLDDLIEATYEIAGSIYYRNYWGPSREITLWDFRQEAAMQILELFKTRFITPPEPGYTKTNLKTYVYSIINRYLVLQLQRDLRDKGFSNIIHIDSYGQGSGFSTGANADYEDQGNLLDVILQKNNDINSYDNTTPDDELLVNLGEEALNRILSSFSVHEIKGTIHRYTSADKTIFSPYNIARLIAKENKTRQEVTEKFIGREALGSSQGVFVRRKYAEVQEQLVDLIKKETESTRKAIIKYLES